MPPSCRKSNSGETDVRGGAREELRWTGRLKGIMVRIVEQHLNVNLAISKASKSVQWLMTIQSLELVFDLLLSIIPTKYREILLSTQSIIYSNNEPSSFQYRSGNKVLSTAASMAMSSGLLGSRSLVNGLSACTSSKFCLSNSSYISSFLSKSPGQNRLTRC